MILKFLFYRVFLYGMNDIDCVINIEVFLEHQLPIYFWEFVWEYMIDLNQVSRVYACSKKNVINDGLSLFAGVCI